MRLVDGRETVAARDQLSLRTAYQGEAIAIGQETYSGCVVSQFKKLVADFRRDGAPKWKHVMHLIRLLLAARSLLLEATLVVDVGPHRERLLEIKRGELPWDEVERWRLSLHEELDSALQHTVLPPTPDVARVDAWLRSVRKRSFGTA